MLSYVEELDARMQGRAILAANEPDGQDARHAGLQSVVKKFMLDHQAQSSPELSAVRTPGTVASHPEGSPASTRRLSTNVAEETLGQSSTGPPPAFGPGVSLPGQLSQADFHAPDLSSSRFNPPPLTNNYAQDIDLESMLAAYMPNENQVNTDMLEKMMTWNWDTGMSAEPVLPMDFGQTPTGYPQGQSAHGLVGANPAMQGSYMPQEDVFGQLNPYRGWMG